MLDAYLEIHKAENGWIVKKVRYHSDECKPSDLVVFESADEGEEDEAAFECLLMHLVEEIGPIVHNNEYGDCIEKPDRKKTRDSSRRHKESPSAD